ncbi:MAG: hypothetical protein IKO49_06365 [Bacilli bacterium]|nr:hypothetical protein [Bacilli bacterium]
MKKFKYLTTILILILVLTGCKNKEEKTLTDATKNTSITEKGLTSYRAKVSISGKDINEKYIVLNKNNKNYTISLDDNKQIYINITKGKKVITDEEGKDYSKEIKYDYTNTDIFLEALNTNDNTIKTKDIKIGNKEYIEYDFNVSKETFNKIMKNFNIEVSNDGNGFAYVDKNSHVFLINYTVDSININVTYTRLNGIK